MSFSDEELERYARHIVLPHIGGAGQTRLKAASAVIVGAGGIGTAVIPSLAAAGFGRLTIIDDDTVQLTDLQRQLIFRSDEIGAGKAVLAAQFAESLNPNVHATTVATRIEAHNAAALLGGHTLIIDGSDNFATRLAVSDASVRLRIPLVTAAAIQLQAQVALWLGGTLGEPCYRCFVGDAFDSDDCDTCAEMGVVGAMAAAAGHFAALLGIRHVVGWGEPIGGRLRLFDGMTAEWRTVRVPKDPACSACGGGNAANA